MTDGMSIRESKLAARVPPPRSNTTRYHGILAPNPRDQEKDVPSIYDSQQPADEHAVSPENCRLIR